jgi:hypothetical protein
MKVWNHSPPSFPFSRYAEDSRPAPAALEGSSRFKFPSLFALFMIVAPDLSLTHFLLKRILRYPGCSVFQRRETPNRGADQRRVHHCSLAPGLPRGCARLGRAALSPSSAPSQGYHGGAEQGHGRGPGRGYSYRCSSGLVRASDAGHCHRNH